MTIPSDCPITDAHAHFFGHRFFKALLSQRDTSGGSEALSDEMIASTVADLGLEPPPSDDVDLARKWVDELDENGVSQIALMASMPPDWPSVAAAVRAYPDRLLGMTMVNPTAADAPGNLDRALDEGGMKAICLFPAMHHFHVYDEAVTKLIEQARRRGASVFCHFGILRIPIRDRLGLRSPFDGTYAVPTDLHRVAQRFPDVTFQIPHFGAGYLRETLFLGVQCPNVVIDTSSSNSWMRLLDPRLDLATVIRMALDAFGPERLLWGSDSSVFPRGWRRDLLEEQLPAYREAGCDDAALRAILGGNARRVFGIQ